MTLLFLFLSALIAFIVIFVSAKHIKKGFEARSEVKEQQRNENVSQEDEEILDKLKDKNLSEEDLKNLYKEIKNKDKEEK